MSNTSDASLPNFTRPEAVAVQKDLALMADLLAGTRRMQDRAREAKYLRKWTDESEDIYRIRKECETVFEGLARVLSAATGMLFAKPPALVWNKSETAMAEHWQNLDVQGTAGPVLAKRFSEAAIRDGLQVILVDHPPSPQGVQVTAANEARLGLRPTWALYQRSQVINWRTETLDNQSVLTLLVLAETATIPVGVYGVVAKKRYRVLALTPTPDGGRAATWKLFEETQDTGVGGFALIGEGVYRDHLGRTRDTLPVAVAYTGRTDAPLTATLPLVGVAWANLSHWRLSTALTFAREVASYAQGVITGKLADEGTATAVIPGKVKLGPLALIHLVGESASFEWKAPPVDAFEPLERGIAEKLKQMGQMGMAFLVTDTRAAETAEAKRLDATAENSTLATAAQAIEDAWNLALEIHAWYLGIEKAGAPVVTINRDFDAVMLDPQTMTVYVDAVVRAGLPVRQLLEAWQRGGRIPADADLDEIEGEMLSGQAAIAEERALNALAFERAA